MNYSFTVITLWQLICHVIHFVGWAMQFLIFSAGHFVLWLATPLKKLLCQTLHLCDLSQELRHAIILIRR